MKKFGKKLLTLLACLAVLYALAGCGASGGNASSNDAADAQVTENAGETSQAETAEETASPSADAETVSLRLGTSAFTVMVPAHFTEGEMTAEDIADDQVAYYRSDATLLDFDVYQFSKEGYPDALADFVTEEAAEYNGTDIVTDAEINGITAGSYRSVEESDGVDYPVITYAFEDNGEYVEIAFWLDGDTAEAEADAIISTLSRES